MVQTNSVINKERIIVIAGPTGVGKSAYGVEIAKKYNGEVISADSVQIYKGLDVGSGKISQDEMHGVPHHMLDIAEPYEYFTVVQYIDTARTIIADIIHRGKVPIIVGGTGFYINALLHGYSCGNAGPDLKLRERLNELGNSGVDLHEKLLEIDPTSGIMKNDIFRVTRQLELLLSPTYDNDENSDYADMYDALLIILDADRAKLDEYAEKRIRQMISAGFIDEVRGLKRYFGMKPLDTVGYKEMRYYVQNEDSITIEETISDMKLSYHGLIKKQQTFLRWIKWDNKVVAMNSDRKSANAAIKKFLEQK